MLGSKGPQQEYRQEPLLNKDCRLPQCKIPWVQVLYTDGWQVRLLDGLTRQRKFITDNIQLALGKV